VNSLHLEGRQVKFGDGIEFKVQSLQGELSAGHDNRPLDEKPPLVNS
jgi:hypothetical protein